MPSVLLIGFGASVTPLTPAKMVLSSFSATAALMSLMSAASTSSLFWARNCFDTVTFAVRRCGFRIISLNAPSPSSAGAHSPFQVTEVPLYLGRDTSPTRFDK